MEVSVAEPLLTVADYVTESGLAIPKGTTCYGARHMSPCHCCTVVQPGHIRDWCASQTVIWPEHNRLMRMTMSEDDEYDCPSCIELAKNVQRLHARVQALEESIRDAVSRDYHGDGLYCHFVDLVEGLPDA